MDLSLLVKKPNSFFQRKCCGKNSLLNIMLLFLISFTLISLVSCDSLIQVCNSKQYKKAIEDTCSNVYKRGKHSKIVFNSYGYYHGKQDHRPSHFQQNQEQKQDQQQQTQEQDQPLESRGGRFKSKFD